MSEMSRSEPHYPDGLTMSVIEALLTEAEETATPRSQPTWAVLDGSAAQRRDRRIARRAIGAVVRALPAHLPEGFAAGEVA
ncbi:hypothetical protein BU204_19305 [Actinophytocola xanthii]|uniref:Uncharacterized protein n=1 Tax=Actinophytocola xanthii TaxID=1912961 RepID=A0A1Q8CNF3_9PSEU|nr:hypothetical protein BU204_19305 [Actinophytocola xanthii]